MEAVGDEFSGAGMLEPSGSEQDDAAQQREKVAVADGVALNVRDAKPVHVSFLLDGGQASNGLSTSSDVPSVPYSTTKVTSGTISKEALGSNQQAGGTCQVSLQNEDEKGIADLSTLVEEEKTDHACVDTEAMVELQQSRSLPDAIALLSKTTDDLEGRVNVLLAQHEEEFFAAFRSHMAKVQKHIENLQACADEQKNLLERDLRIKTLQQELQWFVSEAVRLDQVCKKLKGDLLSWRARTDALREDRDFLEAELKKAKRKLRSSQLQDPSKFCTTLQESTGPQSLSLPAPKSAVPPAIVDRAPVTAHSTPPLVHTPSDDPTVLKETIEDLKKQVSCLIAANRRLQNEAKRNFRMECARNEHWA